MSDFSSYKGFTNLGYVSSLFFLKLGNGILSITLTSDGSGLFLHLCNLI